MIRRAVFFLVLSFASALTFADDSVAVVLEAVRLADLARLAFGELHRTPYVLSPEFDASEVRLSLRLQGVSEADAVEAVTRAIYAQGFELEQRGAVLWIGKKTPEVEEVEIYRPHYRAASYLLDVVAPFFKAGAFGNQRGASLLPSMVPSAGRAQPGASAQQPVASAPFDTGTSAYSLQDRQADVLVFRGTRAEIVKLSGLLAQLDTRMPEVMVKAVVYEVQTNKGDQSALGLAVSVLGSKIGLNAGSVAANVGDYSAVFKSSTLQVVFDALNQDSRFHVVTAPTLRVLSGATAKLLVGNQTPVIGATVVSNGTTSQSVDYKPSGEILNLTPDIRGDVAEFKIDQQISNFSTTITGVNNSPTLTTRELSTTVGIRGDEVLVLGGLDQKQTTETRSGFSFLPTWLSSKSDQDARTEVLVVLQATRI